MKEVGEGRVEQKGPGLADGGQLISTRKKKGGAYGKCETAERRATPPPEKGQKKSTLGTSEEDQIRG